MEEKNANIVAKYRDNTFCPKCLDKLHGSMDISYTDINDLRVCVYISKEHVEILDYKVGEPDWDALKRMNQWQSRAMVEVDTGVNVNNNLSVSQRIPKSSDVSLLLYDDHFFQHMVRFWNMMCSNDEKLEHNIHFGL